ncbi:MAG: hypothetical protein COW10_00155, partial [Candidatus Omnitrophica bacterium CG12_big_fil_rev_8_21_14_0_65_42_8]
MRRLKAFLLSLSGIILITFNIALADDIEVSQVLRIGLDETIKRSLNASEEFKIKGQEVNKTGGIYREVRSNMLPHINAQSSRTYHIDSPAVMNLSDYEDSFGVGASQVIWSFGKVMYAVTSAKRLVEVSRFNHEAGRQEVIFSAKLSYYSTLLARNALSITKESYANTLENKKLLGQRSYGGRGPKYEIIRMDAEVAGRVPAVNEARTQFDVATETLKKLIDADPVS